MKNKIISIVFCVLIILTGFEAKSNPSPFGLELGKATTNDIISKYSVLNKSDNHWDGINYNIDPNSLGLEYLKEAIFIVGSKGTLQAVLLKMPDHRLDFMLESLSEKYKQIQKSTPFMGDKYISFKDGDCRIEVYVPNINMDSDMSVEYRTQEFYELFKQKSYLEKKNENDAQKKLL